jgi:hypothetical protein
VNFVVRNFFSRQIHNNISSWLWKQESLNEWTNWHWHCRTIIERCQFKKKIKSFQSTFKKAKFVKVGVLIWVRIFLENLKKERSRFFDLLCKGNFIYSLHLHLSNQMMTLSVITLISFHCIKKDLTSRFKKSFVFTLLIFFCWLVMFIYYKYMK